MRGGVLVLFFHTLGERVTPFWREATAQADEEHGSCGVLVNDIGFVDRFRLYLRDGLDGVVGDYIYRKTCADRDLRICQIGQIPEIEQIPGIIDGAVYEGARRILQRADRSLYKSLLDNGDDSKIVEDYINVMHAVVMPAVLAEYVEENWGRAPAIFSEKRQRNRSMRRQGRRGSAYSWLDVREALRSDPVNSLVLEELDGRLLRGRTGTPRCRAILLALFEDIAITHQEVRVRANVRFQIALEEAQHVYLKIADGLPANVPYRIRWSLLFKNEFREER